MSIVLKPTRWVGVGAAEASLDDDVSVGAGSDGPGLRSESQA